MRAFEPGTRLLLDWFPGTGRENPTQVEVTFEAIDDGTKITIAHGPGRAGPDLFGRNTPIYCTSWDLVLDAVARPDVVSS